MIKNCIWLALVIGFTGIQVSAQRVPSKRAQRLAAPAQQGLSAAPAQQQGLSESEKAAAVDTSLETTCSQQSPKMSRNLAHNSQVFSVDRIERTMTGIWHGRVSGNYDQQFLTEDGFVNVDYYMIVDAKRGEALVFEQFGDTRAAPVPRAGAPVWSYVTCGRENYTPRHPAQVHEFFKVSDNIEDAREILKTSTGQTFNGPGELMLADVWKQLVDTKYFDNPDRSLAYAGGFFKPFKFENVPVEGGSVLDMDMQAEYRGSGQTAATFEQGEPMRGFERGRFLGVSTSSANASQGAGDFLVASFSLGGLVEIVKIIEEIFLNSVPRMTMTYDKVVIGPLAPPSAGTAALDIKSKSGKTKN